MQCELLCLSMKCPLVPATIGAQDLINREQELRREKKELFFVLLHCSRTDMNFYHVAMKSVTKETGANHNEKPLD